MQYKQSKSGKGSASLAYLFLLSDLLMMTFLVCFDTVDAVNALLID